MKNYERRAITYYLCVLFLITVFGFVYGAIVEDQENKQLLQENSTTVKFSDEVKSTEDDQQPARDGSDDCNEYLKYLGEFWSTSYCSCSKCCYPYSENRPKDENGNTIVIGASGEELIPGVSVAVDPNVIPYGSVLVIDGQEYIAHDTGGNIKGNRIDFYYSSHEEALSHENHYCKVYIKISYERTD